MSLIPLDRVTIVKVVRIRYVEFLYDNKDWPMDCFRFGESVKISARDHAAVNLPAEAIGYQFYDAVQIMVEIDGVKYRLSKSHCNNSSYYFPQGKWVSLKDIPEEEQKWLDEDDTKFLQVRTGRYYGFGGPTEDKYGKEVL